MESRGGILIMTLVFVSMFAVIFIALMGFVNRSYHETVLQAHDELAFQVAESGLNYARWRLAHDGDNFTSETRSVTDQFAGTLGTYELTFDAPAEGGTVVTITSVGQTASQPTREVTLRARYGIPSLARYAYVINSDVWYKAEIHGPTHANGGIRMDGQSDSLVTSAQETYTCKPLHGCSNQTRPGIWGTGEEQELWEFPAPPVDYTALTLDLLNIKTAAQDQDTYYGPSGGFGYHIVFRDDNTYRIYRVTQKRSNIRSCDYEPNWTCSNQSHDIQQEVLLETKAVPDGGVIFTEDHVWVEGDIRDRVTLAAGRFPENPGSYVDVIINGSITYDGVQDGTRSFAAIAQRHVLIPYYAAPADLVLNGAFIAQKGKFGRRHYDPSDNPDTHDLKDSLTTFGMIASNLVPGTTWSSGSTVTSGYQYKVQTYDPNFLYNPPPYFPTDGQYEFISWEEEQ